MAITSFTVPATVLVRASMEMAYTWTITRHTTTGACSREPTVIDGSSQQAFEKTTEKARRDLPIKDRLTFDAALHNPGGVGFAHRDTSAASRAASAFAALTPAYMLG